MFKNTTKTQRIIMAVTAVGAGIFMMYVRLHRACKH